MMLLNVTIMLMILNVNTQCNDFNRSDRESNDVECKYSMPLYSFVLIVKAMTLGVIVCIRSDCESKDVGCHCNLSDLILKSMTLIVIVFFRFDCESNDLSAIVFFRSDCESNDVECHCILSF